MQLRFGDCELDTRVFTLRRAGAPQPLEPLVFDLLAYLAKHRDRVVDRKELFDALWPGKVVCESTLGGCIKAARRAVGDDGQAQWCIATLPRRGYRFVAPVGESGENDRAADAGRRARIAVFPLVGPLPGERGRGGPADALVQDIITGLACLRSLFVIAPGTVFSLHAQGMAARDAAAMLRVDYLVCGRLEVRGGKTVLTAELVAAQDLRLIWSDTFAWAREALLQARDHLARRIVASIASEVELSERNRALLKPPEALDAWEAYHRGLWHMYLFTQEDNAKARQLFEQAVARDPGFAPAHAGLSFTHFQDAFQHWEAPPAATERAFAAAGRSLVADERNPASHWAMGRALWLRGQEAPAVAALERAVALSPSFALGHYTLAFVHAQTGDPQAAIACSDHARQLSPFDPLLFGMLGARALALVRQGRFEEAAGCAVEAAAQPNAHPHILAIAACTLALAGRLEPARAQAAALRRQRPRYGLADFLAAFRLDGQGACRFGEGARRIGMD